MKSTNLSYKEKNNVKLKDLAEILDVSVNTVSRALRDKDDISASLKDKVKKLAKDLNYIPNQLSDYIREGLTSIVGVVVGSLSNPYYILACQELVYNLQNKGYVPMILVSKENKFNEELLFKFIYNQVCGIVSFCDVTEVVFNLCKQRNFPIVTVGVTPLNAEISAVYNDDYYAGKIVAEEFINIGLKRPCYINSDLEIVNRYRREGFIQNIKNVKVNEYYLKYSERDKLIDKVVNCIKDNNNDFIFCFNDEIANFIIDSLRKNNYKNYTIYGVDGISKYFPYSKQFNSVGFDFEKLIQIVCRVLFNKIENGDTNVEQIKYKGELIKCY